MIKSRRKETIENWDVYGLSESIRGAKFPMSADTDVLDYELTAGIAGLAKSAPGDGHDQWLTGVIVQFDLTLTIKAWVEAERYHFLDFVSSQSTMHRVARFDLDNSYDPHTDPRCIEVVKELVDAYNENPSIENYLNVLMSNPCGMRLTARMTTNYRQLKTIYRQRKDHRLPDWREFCRWIEGLPHSELITGDKG